MISALRDVADLLIKVFAFGLLVSIVLSWFEIPSLWKAKRELSRFYDIFLNPIRRFLVRMRVSAWSTAGLDLAPLILLLLLWLFIHPFLMWLLH